MLPPVNFKIGSRTETWRGRGAEDGDAVVDPVPAAPVRRVFEMPEMLDCEWETPDWETLLDDRPLEYADLDAYFAELD